jgi:hypothetical protein
LNNPIGTASAFSQKIDFTTQQISEKDRQLYIKKVVLFHQLPKTFVP